jgi:hypothetical protein
MNVFVVISVAAPKDGKSPAPPAVKISAVCTRSSRAQEIADRLNKQEMIVGNKLCKIQVAAVEIQLDES